MTGAGRTSSATLDVEGHIIDSLTLAKVLDLVLAAGADYRMVDVQIGRTNHDSSRARIEVLAADEDALARLVAELQVHGANPVDEGSAELVACDQDGVLPAGFYSTTNLATRVRVDDRWLEVDDPEMDCALVVTGAPDDHAATTYARCVPMHRVTVGDLVVVGGAGVRVEAPERPRGSSPFEFMTSEVSSEKPKALLVEEVAGRIRRSRAAGGKALAVCGPAVIHTGGGPSVARLVRDGWIDVLFAGNGFAAHDLESNVLGTSLGVPVAATARAADGGPSNHLRVINEVRRHGSVEAAVEAGYVTSGVLYECCRRSIPVVLAGSIRDDGPLPDVITDVVAATDTMRLHVPGVTVALMLASTLHAIATGNLLPAGVETYCVDINAAVVTKLADRGSHQALGIVTDVGPFLADLVEALGSGPG